jgi:spheroidene monooxygenase
MFKIGIGELPWMQQVTFSIWPDANSMAAFARADGPHARAIKAVRDGGLVSRRALRPLLASTRRKGIWDGVAPDLTHRPHRHIPDPIEVAAE